MKNPRPQRVKAKIQFSGNKMFVDGRCVKEYAKKPAPPAPSPLSTPSDNAPSHDTTCNCKVNANFLALTQKLVEAIEKAIMRLGAPTMDYAPEIAVREYKDSIEEVVRVLLKAAQEAK